MNATTLAPARKTAKARPSTSDEASGPIKNEAIRAEHAEMQHALDSLWGHSSKQAQLAFAEIATQANTMLTMVRNSGGDAEQAVAIARVGFQMIGSIADHMCGFEVVGTPADWAIGDSFCEAGKAVQT